MPINSACPKCAIVGQVRVEHVIQGGVSYRALHCFACGYQWRVLETGEHLPSTERPDRSRLNGEHLAMDTTPERRVTPADRRKPARGERRKK